MLPTYLLFSVFPPLHFLLSLLLSFIVSSPSCFALLFLSVLCSIDLISFTFYPLLLSVLSVRTQQNWFKPWVSLTWPIPTRYANTIQIGRVNFYWSPGGLRFRWNPNLWMRYFYKLCLLGYYLPFHIITNADKVK